MMASTAATNNWVVCMAAAALLLSLCWGLSSAHRDIRILSTILDDVVKVDNSASASAPTPTDEAAAPNYSWSPSSSLSSSSSAHDNDNIDDVDIIHAGTCSIVHDPMGDIDELRQLVEELTSKLECKHLIKEAPKIMRPWTGIPELSQAIKEASCAVEPHCFCPNGGHGVSSISGKGNII